MNLAAGIYQGCGAEERKTRKRRPPAKIGNRLRPHLARWRRIDIARSAELHAAGILSAGEEIAFVVKDPHKHDNRLRPGHEIGAVPVAPGRYCRSLKPVSLKCDMFRSWNAREDAVKSQLGWIALRYRPVFSRVSSMLQFFNLRIKIDFKVNLH